jgi:HK97 family phage portal protein
MKIFGLEITRPDVGLTTLGISDVVVKRAPLQSVDSRGGWYPVIRESYTGAWQQNVEVRLENVMTFSAVYACVTVPARDIGKLRIKLVEQMRDGIWQEVDVPAFSPVLRMPNHFQTRIQFLEQWITCKRMHGNTYVLKHRDKRGVVIAMYVLDPSRVRPMVAPNGDVYYEVKRDDLTGLTMPVDFLPAREIIHDVMNPIYHPLVGISPISACGLSATQGLRIQNNSATFFANGSNPSGVLTAPGLISQETADRAKAYWETEFTGDNFGKVAVLGDGLKYEAMTMSAVDAQLIDQLNFTGKDVCTAFHIQPYKIGIGPMPTHNNIEALQQEYYAETLQADIEAIELLLDKGLGLLDGGVQRYGVELDLSGLIRMDTTSRVNAAEKALKAGMTINEVRREFYDKAPVTGGDTVYLQQQMFSLEALAKRDDSADPFGTATPEPTPEPVTTVDEGEESEGEESKFAAALLTRATKIAKRISRAE